jgi:hypothetical protein
MKELGGNIMKVLNENNGNPQFYFVLDSQSDGETILYRADLGCLITGEWCDNIKDSIDSLDKMLVDFK